MNHIEIISRRIALVIPPSPFLMDERVFVNLGLLKVAAVLENAGHVVSVVDLSGVQDCLGVFEAFLKGSDDEIIGFTITTPQLPSALKLVQLARKNYPNIRLIAGGPHVTLVHSALKIERKQGNLGRATAAMETLKGAFDVLCVGDGEMTILQAVLPHSPPLIDGDDRKVGLFMTDKIYDSTPLPARHLVDLSSYKYTIDERNSTSLISQLGCPFNCGFCGGRNSNSLRIIRTRSIESIVNEIESLYKDYGYTGFMFYDDELNVNKSFVKLMDAISDLQERLGVDFRLRGFIKAELFNETQARAMYRAGFRWILCGFEAGHPRILSNIEKRATLDDNTQAVEIAKRHGLRIKALMSIGHPGESYETAYEVSRWLVNVAVEDFDCTIITTYPGTPYYDLSVPHPTIDNAWTYTAKSGDRLHSCQVDFATTADYYKGAPGNYHAYVFTDYMTSADLVRARDNIESEVRSKLKIPFNQARAAILYEHSMGQNLPANILRKSELTLF